MPLSDDHMEGDLGLLLEGPLAVDLAQRVCAADELCRAVLL